MPAATASGADAKANGDAAKNREHKQGNQDRKYTIEQKTAVIRIRKCSTTAYYEILGVEKTCSDGEIKKAYRKLSLLTHPDKNGYEGSDEAFKMVSRAFQVLSDADKKDKFDRFGGDPDSRFGGGAGSSASPFSGFARSPGGRGPMFEDEISPEELFNRFFGGGGGMGPFGGGGMFDTGPQFVFNLGGGPGFRVHQFGGGQPRRRPQGANAANNEPQSAWSVLSQLLPLLILFVIPLLSSLFSSSMPTGPNIYFQGGSPNLVGRTTPLLNVHYFVEKNQVAGWEDRKLRELDKRAENKYITNLQYDCQHETRIQNRMMEDAQGWFFQDVEKMTAARNYDMKACRRLDSLRYPRNGY